MGCVCSLEVLSFTRSARRPLSPGPRHGPQAHSPQPLVVRKGAPAPGAVWAETWAPLPCSSGVGGHTCPNMHLPSFSTVRPTHQGQHGLQQSEGQRGPGVLPALGPMHGRGWRCCRSPVIRGSSPGGVAGAAMFTGSLAARCSREAACVGQVWEGAGTHSSCRAGSVLHRRVRPCLVPWEAGAEPELGP